MFGKDGKQLIRVDGKGVFLEVLNYAFPIEKVQFRFIQYDATKEKKNRIVKSLNFYIDFSDALLFAQDVLSGRMVKLAEIAKGKQKEGNHKYCSPIYQRLGGVNAEKLKERNQARGDGKCLSRQFKMTPGDKVPWILSVEQGSGVIGKTGLIMPEKGGVEEWVRVPVQNDDLKRIALVIESHIKAYLAGYYAKHGEYNEPKKYEKEGGKK